MDNGIQSENESGSPKTAGELPEAGGSSGERQNDKAPPGPIQTRHGCLGFADETRFINDIERLYGHAQSNIADAFSCLKSAVKSPRRVMLMHWAADYMANVVYSVELSANILEKIELNVLKESESLKNGPEEKNSTGK